MTDQARTAQTCSARSSHVRTVTPTEMALLALIIVVLFAAAWLSGGRTAGAVPETRRLRVEPGQTLWSIAREHPAPGLSTAETVQILAQINGLKGAGLVAGEMLEVPKGTPPSGEKLASR